MNRNSIFARSFNKNIKVSNMKKGFLFFLVALSALSASAQITMPQPSPGATFTQKVGLTEIKFDYSRPSMKGRKIFGELVPFGEIWRTGANNATKFTTLDSITIEGKGLAKGTYVLLTRPFRDQWEVIFNKNPDVSVFNYKPEDDVLKLIAKVSNTSEVTENFEITTDNITSNACTVILKWENTKASFNIVNDIDTKIKAQIQAKLDGPTGDDYYTMSRFYFENSRDLSKALEFADLGITKGGEKYWTLRNKSLIQAKLGDKKNAIETAKKSLELSKKEKNMDYIRMNDKSILEWSAK